MKKNIFASIIVFIFVNIFAHAQGTDLYEYISKNIISGACLGIAIVFIIRHLFRALFWKLIMKLTRWV
jgi:hypothetical protein